MFRKAILVTGEGGVFGVLRESFLAREGFTVIPARSGAETLRLVEEQDPALAVLDLDSPEFVECRRRLHGDVLLRRTPLLLLASGAGEARACCGEQVLRKPVDKKCLLAAACRLLGIERQADPRPAVFFTVRIGRTGQKQHPGRVHNLSGGGAFIETGRLFPVDTEVLVEMLLPAGAGIFCRGRIAWVNHPEWVKKPTLPAGMGVEFVGLGETEKAAVAALLAEKISV